MKRGAAGCVKRLWEKRGDKKEVYSFILYVCEAKGARTFYAA